MLYYLHQFTEVFAALNVFRYVTFRALAAALTALVVCWIVGPGLIRVLRRLKAGQPLRGKEEVRGLAELHGVKKGTPTMGGLLIILAVVVATVLWARPDHVVVWVCLGSMLLLGAVGFADDYLKVRRKKSDGLPGRYKLLCQGALAVAVALVLFNNPHTREIAQTVFFPFFKEWTITGIGWAAVLLFTLVIMGSSNAVNLTDGLDGLAAGCMLSVTLAYGILCYAAGHAEIARYLFVPHVVGAAELSVFCAAILGACLGFLWFNCHPAQVFMGDTGSLALGGTLGVIAICIGQELLLILAGGVFVLEALSVIIQVASFKSTGKRVFRMAPLHHHFELGGWSETTVTIRFWILSLLFALLSLASLKLR